MTLVLPLFQSPEQARRRPSWNPGFSRRNDQCGKGLVDTPNDFGHQGALPTHLKLLDWLASPVYDDTRFDVDNPPACRRAVYRHLVRSVTDLLMDCFDAADPSQLVARRNTTPTALQALATLNNAFALRQCEHFADRLNKMSNDVNTQIEAACQWALARKPAQEEAKQLAAYAQKPGLANACRVIFNSTEFMFID